MCIMQLFLVSTTLLRSEGRYKSSLVRRGCFKNKSAGETPVVALEVFLYANRKRANLVFRDPGSFFAAFKACLNVCTNLSASPFDARW